MARWNKADIPHKGWKYIEIEDLGEDVYPGEEIRYEQWNGYAKTHEHIGRTGGRNR